MFELMRPLETGRELARNVAQWATFSDASPSSAAKTKLTADRSRTDTRSGNDLRCLR